jgi:hypothetical protein
MFRRRFVATLAFVSTLLLLLLGSLLLTPSVLAQCGEPPKSSCMTCHEKEAPVAENGEWHVVHASKDICLNCHGGNGSTMEKDLAHEGMMAEPLADIYTDCHSCHPDYQQQAAQYAPILGITPGSCATPTPIAVGNNSDGPTSGSSVVPSELVATASLPTAFFIASGGMAALALFLLALIWLASHPA